MWTIKKQVFMGAATVLLMLCGRLYSDNGVRTQAWYANARQDVITFDAAERSEKCSEDLFAPVHAAVTTGDKTETTVFRLNNEPVGLHQLGDRLKGSDSVCVIGCDVGADDGLIQQLIDLLEQLGRSGIPDPFINLNMEYLPSGPVEECHVVRITPDGALTMEGTPVALSDLPKHLTSDQRIAVESDPAQPPPPLSAILNVVQMVGRRNIHHLFIADRCRQVQVSARIIQVDANGVEDELAAPRLTTQPGFDATIRVVHNNSGYEPCIVSNDPFCQEDLANLGVRFSVRPVLLGDRIRVSGVLVLVRQPGFRKEAFVHDGVPIFSYAASKYVCPFSCVMPPDQEYVEIPVAKVDGMKTVCRLNAVLVNERGEPRGAGRGVREAGRQPENGL